MRAHKYKVWDKINKRWISAFSFKLSSSGDIMAVEDVDGEIYGLHQVDILDYIGLGDKNGREIYEGDIVECKDMHDINIDYWGIKPPRYTIGWNSYDASFCLVFHNGLPLDLSSYWEVIGNIYEDSSLLGGEK